MYVQELIEKYFSLTPYGCYGNPCCGNFNFLSWQITKLIIQLRAYETGEFGLSEALAQIKDLSQQRLVRDKHIEQLVETANMLKSTCDSLQEENLTLRYDLQLTMQHYVQIISVHNVNEKKYNLEKVPFKLIFLSCRNQLKISPEEHVHTSASVLKNKEQNVIQIQQQQIDRLEEDLISAKIDVSRWTVKCSKLNLKKALEMQRKP